MERNKTTDILAERIGKLRAGANESQQDLADKIGVKRETVKFWESGDRQIKGADIVKLAKHFKVSADYLLGLAEVPTNDKDLQFVCSYTHLSEESIKAILEIPTYVGGEGYLHSLDVLISRYGLDIARLLRHIEERVNEANHYLETPYIQDPERAPIIDFDKTERLIEQIEVATFRFSQNISNIPDDYLDADWVISKLLGRQNTIVFETSGTEAKEAADDGQHTED